MLRTTGLVVALVALVGLAAATAGSPRAARAPVAATTTTPPTTSTPTPNPGALLRRFEPVLYFHPEEDWSPEPVEAFVGRARVEKQIARGVWAAAPAPLPTTAAGCTLSPCYRFNLPCALKSGDGCYERASVQIADWAHPTIYGRVVPVPAGSAAPPGVEQPPAYLVRYWLFYEFDDWRTPRERLWQAHEADWESITIGLDAALKPLFAAYSEHCSGTIRPWKAVPTRNRSHPVAWVALGSHALYFSNASTPTAFSQCLSKYLQSGPLAKARRIVGLAEERLLDRMGTAHQSGPPGMTGATPLTLVELNGTPPPWATFPGRWSEGQLLWLGRTPRSLTSVSEGLGPATPNWNATSVPSYWHAASS